MSSDTEQEPSIEEILTSIRQIISDDDEESGDEAQEKSTAEEAPEAEDVIELTEKADAEPEPAPEPEPIEDEIVPDPEPEVEITPDEPEDDILKDIEPSVDMNIDMQAPESDPVEDIFAEDSDDSLLTDRAEEAALGAFKELAAKTAIDSISGVTIEQIVRDEIRPMLKVWLDSNLPSLVERLVQEELDRVARRALDN